MAGGSSISINGDGFVPSQTAVVLGSSTFQLKNSNANIAYTSINFETLPNQEGAYELSVYVNGFQAVCSNNNCNYTFTSAATPKLTAVSPNTLSDSNTLITITGQNFGSDSSKVKVSIGGEDCAVASTSQTTITCTLNRLALGNQAVMVTIDGKYF